MAIINDYVKGNKVVVVVVVVVGGGGGGGVVVSSGTDLIFHWPYHA